MKNKKCSCRCHKSISHNFECIEQTNKQIKETRNKRNLVCICGSDKTYSICSDCFINHPGHEHYDIVKSGSEILNRL